MDLSKTPFPKQTHEADFCVVGGGMAGLCAALAAARRGARTVLMHDRPVLGGNSSSEIGVHVIGADRVGAIPHMRETGILEELRLENLFRNPQGSLSLWDLVLYAAARREAKLTLLLNCSCLDAEMDPPPHRDRPGRISSVTGWQLTTQTWHTVRARIFADCSGDAILAPLTAAEHRMGREARAEYGESIATPEADERTMGMTCIFYTRRHEQPMPFEPLPWARTFQRCDELPWGEGNHSFWLYSPWWCELGGEQHSIRDTEAVRDELLKVILGLWDHIKNRCVHSDKAANWALDRVQFLPGKRESRRYVGRHVLRQQDVEGGGRFEDTVAYGGWTMDDHHPAGFESFTKCGQPPTIHHPAPSPYGIPYRCLYSRNVANLMFAGRVASCTHVAMSSTRVMGTCSSMGQAVGTAAALAVRKGLDPAGVVAQVRELQQMLLADDAYLPGVVQEMSPATRQARLETSQGAGEPLRDGINRQVGEDCHCWIARPAWQASYLFDGPQDVREVALMLDSGMERIVALRGPGWSPPLPDVIPRTFRIDVRTSGAWQTAARIDRNAQRFLTVPVNRRAEGVRFVLEETWGAPESRVYGFLVNPLHRL